LPSPVAAGQLTGHATQTKLLRELTASSAGLADRLDAAGMALVTEGAVVLGEVPVHRDEVLLALCARFGPVTHVDNGPPPGQLVRELRWSPTDGERPALRLHTDSAYSPQPHAVIALACVHNTDADWGDSVLASVSDVAERLARTEFAALVEMPVVFTKTRSGHVEQRHSAPVLEPRAPGLTCRLNLDHLTTDPLTPAVLLAAIDRLADLLADAAVQVKLRPGDLLLIDNRRVLHGRTPLAGQSGRLLRRLKLASEAHLQGRVA
jgi:alpha-ketoglutarate-dependent taurine dioxygenase